MKWFKYLLISLLLNVGLAQSQGPAPGVPPGTLGWWTYGPGPFVGTEPRWSYTSDPISACQGSAYWHMGTALVDMTLPTYSVKVPTYSCWYPHFISWVGVHDYATTFFACETGYTPVFPGVCVKRDETAKPMTCGNPARPLVGNPVSPLTGTKVEAVEDYAAGPSGARLQVLRHYRGIGAYEQKSAGMGWSFSFDRTIVNDGIGAPVVRLEDSLNYRFLPLNGVYGASESGADVSLRISDAALNEWEFRGRNDRLDRFRLGKLVSSKERGGYEQFFSYGPVGQLQTITDSFGRSIDITWSGTVVSSVRSATTQISYLYLPAWSVGTIVVPGTERLTHVITSRLDGSDATVVQYHYEDPNNRFLLTGITDETGTRYANFGYDLQARATLTEHANGAQRVQLTYNSDGSTAVIDALGSARTYTSQLVNGSYRSTGVSQPGGAGCAPSAQNLTYDPFGNLTSSRDFNNRLSCFTNNTARSLEIKRVEGLNGASCPGAVVAGLTRTINTEWHADFRLPARIAEPGRIVTNTYDLVGNLLSRSEQATTDTTGALGFSAVATGTPRVWTYTYNAVGQMLSADGPLAGTTDRTTYEYYLSSDTAVPPKWRVGDLMKITNAIGHVTTFDEYDPEGRLLKETDPNSAVTVSTYHLRGWLTSVSTTSGGTSQTVSYDYWPTGKLKKVVQADGSFLSYSYDAAQRLTGIVDNLGNTVSYTLDAAGNRTAESFKDTGGVLKRNIARSFDALSRVQSVTGAMQ